MIKRGVLGGLLAVLLVGVVGVGAWFTRVVDNLGGNGLIDGGIRAILSDSDVAREPFYVLLLGTDGRPGEEVYRSDSIILARIDPTEKKASLISIPRDTMVVYNGETMKINATHAVNGPQGVVEAVNDLCFNGEQKISHYAEINFEGMEDLIDAVGGIDLEATEEVDDPEHLDIKIEKGFQHMDGATALTYARCRYTYADGDFTRMRHQRQVLSALAKKILNDLDPATIMGTVEELSKVVITTLGVQDIVSVANAMRGMDVENDMYVANVPSYADETTNVNGVSYVFVYEDKLAEMMQRLDAGENPEGPQTMGEDTSGASTAGDIMTDSSSETDGEGVE
ncbi:MAG: LCP family protein [Collinsella stercoris]|uniref:LCP family protein n=1 Tax=Collinsella stercoris TaxID=147206 RepID=UPI00248DE37D|nr:LCP family protein [Collinsella stercoris]